MLLETCRFFRVCFVPLLPLFFVLVWSVRRTFFPSSRMMVFFYLVTTGCIYDISLSENSVIPSKISLSSDDCPPSCLFPIHHYPQPRSSSVVYQIQRIGCQPGKNNFLHGGQSCSSSAEQEDEIKQRKSGSAESLLPPRAVRSEERKEKKIEGA